MPELSDPSPRGCGPQGTTGPTCRIHLSAAGVSTVLDVTGGRIPAILHWGPALGEITPGDAEALAAVTTPPVANNAPDIPLRLGILPQNADGWLGTPGLTGSRADGSGFAPRLTCRSVQIDHQDTSEGFVETELTSSPSPWWMKPTGSR